VLLKVTKLSEEARLFAAKYFSIPTEDVVEECKAVAFRG
jgi:hypothetical protein